jgi:hypothetical protein
MAIKETRLINNLCQLVFNDIFEGVDEKHLKFLRDTSLRISPITFPSIKDEKIQVKVRSYAGSYPGKDSNDFTLGSKYFHNDMNKGESRYICGSFVVENEEGKVIDKTGNIPFCTNREGNIPYSGKLRSLNIFLERYYRPDDKIRIFFVVKNYQ